MAVKKKQLRQARVDRGWTQQRAAGRLRVSQPYLALLESGERPLTRELAERAARVYRLHPTALPLPPLQGWERSAYDPAFQLGALGYPGFGHLRGAAVQNPAQVLMDALAREMVEARVLEALPWLLLQYPELDQAWLVAQAKLNDSQNRLGFVVSLARHLLERKGEIGSQRHAALQRLEDVLSRSRLAVEDTAGQAGMSEKERGWVRRHRSRFAAEWNVVSDLRPEHLPYAA